MNNKIIFTFFCFVCVLTVVLFLNLFVTIFFLSISPTTKRSITKRTRIFLVLQKLCFTINNVRHMQLSYTQSVHLVRLVCFLGREIACEASRQTI